MDDQSLSPCSGREVRRLIMTYPILLKQSVKRGTPRSSVQPDDDLVPSCLVVRWEIPEVQRIFVRGIPVNGQGPRVGLANVEVDLRDGSPVYSVLLRLGIERGRLPFLIARGFGLDGFAALGELLGFLVWVLDRGHARQPEGDGVESRKMHSSSMLHGENGYK